MWCCKKTLKQAQLWKYTKSVETNQVWLCDWDSWYFFANSLSGNICLNSAPAWSDADSATLCSTKNDINSSLARVTSAVRSLATNDDKDGCNFVADAAFKCFCVERCLRRSSRPPCEMFTSLRQRVQKANASPDADFVSHLNSSL